MSKILRRLFRRRAYVYREWNGVHVRGDEYETMTMMIACMLALKKYGWNIDDVRTAIKNMTKEETNE